MLGGCEELLSESEWTVVRECIVRIERVERVMWLLLVCRTIYILIEL